MKLNKEDRREEMGGIGTAIFLSFIIIFTCDMYWGDNAEAIWNQLKDITNGKDNS